MTTRFLQVMWRHVCPIGCVCIWRREVTAWIASGGAHNRCAAKRGAPMPAPANDTKLTKPQRRLHEALLHLPVFVRPLPSRVAAGCWRRWQEPDRELEIVVCDVE